MYKMHMYRDGTLPVVRQHVHSARLDILRCSYWVMRIWNHRNLAAPFWRLYWNSDAGAEIRWQGREIALGPECLVLISPHTPFTTRYHGGAKADGADNMLLGCPAAEWDDERHPDEQVVHQLFTHFLAGPPCDMLADQLFILPLDPTMRASLQSLMTPVSADQEALTRRHSFQLRALLYFALAQVPEALWPAPQTDERVVTVMRFIDEQYDQPLTNDDFAGLAAMSAKAFVRLFKQKMKLTPLAYLQQRRLEKASILLHHSDESIERIAERCGFYDRHHFSKLFQRTFHVGPATYRKARMV